MNYIDAIQELKYSTAIMLRAYGDCSKVLCYFLVKALDFFDPSTDPKEIYKICGLMLETVRVSLYQKALQNNAYQEDEAKEEWHRIEARPFSGEFDIEDYQDYKRAVLEGLNSYDSRNSER